MNSANRLHDTLHRVATRMRLDFEESAAIQHNASKGTVRERDVQQDFLEKYLPSVVRVSGSGELVSADGQVSGQCDLMVVDVETPPLWAKEDYAIVPVECCHIVVEVKSNLTVAELKKSWAAARKAKSLPRTAYLPNPSPISYTRVAYGRQWENAVPLRYVIFAYDSATLDTLGKEMSVLAQQDPDPAIGIDAVCVLNRGILSWIEPGTSVMFDRRPDSYVFTTNTEPGNVLLFLVTSLNDITSATRHNEKFDLKAYVKESMGDFDGFWRAGDRYLGVPTGAGGAQVLVKFEE
jgi:hypothetical protein